MAIESGCELKRSIRMDPWDALHRVAENQIALTSRMFDSTTHVSMKAQEVGSE